MGRHSDKPSTKKLDGSQRVRIALDAMGGDFGPSVIVEGAVMAVDEYGAGLELVLVGDSTRIAAEVERLGIKTAPFETVHTTETVSMSESAIKAYRRKKDSSLSVSLGIQKKGEVSATVSAGHTGAVMTHALLILGRLEGVLRPAIAAAFPTEQGVTLLIDAGANPDCKPQHLYQFGVMGSVYTSIVHRKKTPRVGLLSIGEEASKGNELTVATNKLFAASKLNFIGNTEGRDILKGKSDVVVCDGFVGNVMLKFAESVGGFFREQAKQQVGKNLLSMLGALLMRSVFRRVRERLDYAEHGGAPLLGIDGITIICHGGSSPKAIKNAIGVAVVTALDNINNRIKEDLKANAGLYDSEQADRIEGTGTLG